LSSTGLGQKEGSSSSSGSSIDNGVNLRGESELFAVISVLLLSVHPCKSVGQTSRPGVVIILL
jgi:hypothetical protein